MECPICKQEMKEVSKDVSHNPRDKKEYERTLYQCIGDDVWLTTEIPKEG